MNTPIKPFNKPIESINKPMKPLNKPLKQIKKNLTHQLRTTPKSERYLKRAAKEKVSHIHLRFGSKLPQGCFKYKNTYSFSRSFHLPTQIKTDLFLDDFLQCYYETK